MNPNAPYGQQLPMQPPQRRHDVPYNQMPPQMRPIPAYQQYYPQPMGPMMPQYPQHYQQNWYPYQNHMHPHHAGRPQYYPQPPPMPLPQQHHMQQHQGPLIVSSHPQPRPQPSPRHMHGNLPPYPPHPPSTTSTTSVPQIQTPPSRPTSTTSIPNAKIEATPPATSVAANAVTVTPSNTIPPILVEPVAEPAAPKEPFVPPLPWLSVPEEPFPKRAQRARKRILRSSLGTEPIVFPLQEKVEEVILALPTSIESQSEQLDEQQVVPTPTQTPTPLLSDTLSETVSTQPTTPSSVVAPKSQTTPTQPKVGRAAVPVVPVVPILPQSPTAARTHRDSVTSATSKTEERALSTDPLATEGDVPVQPSESSMPVVPAPPPSSWAALLRSKNAGAAAAAAATPSSVANGLGVPKTETLGDILSEINVNEVPSKVAFLQPRGLVNTGNMCYMNSILQMLVFCIPFYEFLDRVARRAPHTFKSDTPLIDAMIMFLREYPTIDSTTSVEQLRLRLKPDDYERYGDSFIPEYVYNVIKELPRFRDMRRGQQQDAQEFLGFLLEELHEECAHAMRSGSSGTSTPVGSSSALSEAFENNEGGWMEVGHKQKAAVTRSSGAIATESPISSIFGGKLRSELKVSGNKLSVTLEPYQSLQLDIGSPQVNNVVEALKGLTIPESMQGDFQSARGTKATATKQVLIETLPPVLILHLKRFHYDNTTKHVEKIWKKIGYPLELELPKEVFPPSARNKFAAHGGLPKYRLIGVIYHHGKNANGGHYTVDIRRQDGREWIRVDDTMIRRVRSEDVAEGGSEEDPKVLAAALQRHKEEKATGNRFEQIDDNEEEAGSEKQWSQVNGHARSKSNMTAIINGSATPAKNSSGLQTPRDKFSLKDNKVAYLLFYQKIVV